jgi:transcriptional repressor NrdR
VPPALCEVAAAGNVAFVRCPWCSADHDKVVDSRSAEEGSVIRRRRECLHCGRRYTTFERVDELPLFVVKRSGQREPFERAKLIAGLEAASKNRPVTAEELDAIARQIEEDLRESTDEPTTQQVGVAVLERLRSLDQVAYLRFASVYKGFEDAGDFQREVGLLTKTTKPKRRP